MADVEAKPVLPAPAAAYKAPPAAMPEPKPAAVAQGPAETREGTPGAEHRSAPAAPGPTQETGEQAVINDPLVKQAVELFGARIVHVEVRKR